MERKRFLRSLVIGAVASPMIIEACKKSSSSSVGTTTTPTGGSSIASCSIAPTETEGPFPTHAPASYVRSDITDGKTGYKLTIKLVVGNSNNGCNPLANAIVDLWHCDADGNYSEYGGSGTQSTNYTGVHFLRGRQTTDSTGAVTFTSIFPGWYNGRTTHIHLHVFNAGGTSLKVTQIAFPEGTGSAVSLVNGYGKGMGGYTYNKNDNVFSDDTSGIEIATVTGSLTTGFILNMQVSVPA